MQKNIVIFLILHIFIYFTVISNSHEVIQKCFYFLCLLNYVHVQINALLVEDLGRGKKSIQVTFNFSS